MQQQIQTEFRGGVGRIRLNRPNKRNALTRDMLDSICRAVQQLQQQADLRVVVFEAAGTCFCAGMDLAQMQAHATAANCEELWREDSESYHAVLLALLNCRVPTIAVLPGPAIAGGVGLALSCDMIIAVDSAYFELPEPSRGIAAAMVKPLLLRRTSVARAGYLLLSGRKLPAEKAFTFGLCDEVVPPSDCDLALQTILQSILDSSPQALSVTKRFLDVSGNIEMCEALERAVGVSADARASADAREGLDAFLGKRKPVWEPPEETP